MTEHTNSPETAENDPSPVIGVSGVPVNHVAIDMSSPQPPKAQEPLEEKSLPPFDPAKPFPEMSAPQKSEEKDLSPSVEIIGIRFKSNGKIYYFDPCGIHGKKGECAIVETARGQEFGEIALENTHVPESEIVPPIRPLLRIATEEDRCHHLENKKKEADALTICQAKIESHGLDMKLVEAQYTFDNSKLLFYFTSAGRVDFRELVKDLASVFRTRIELRQIGIRDEAKLIGGLGSCGRALCCSGFLSDFGQVSIKMAKEQNLSLNSTKISGTCGRLMCCLRYEYDTYLEEARLTPAVDSTVKTPDGVGTVVEATPLLGTVKVRLSSAPDAEPSIYHRDNVTVLSRGKRPFEESPDEQQTPVIPSPNEATDPPARRATASADPKARREKEEPPAFRKKDERPDEHRYPPKSPKRNGEEYTRSFRGTDDDASYKKSRTPAPNHHNRSAPYQKKSQAQKPRQRSESQNRGNGDAES